MGGIIFMTVSPLCLGVFKGRPYQLAYNRLNVIHEIFLINPIDLYSINPHFIDWRFFRRFRLVFFTHHHTRDKHVTCAWSEFSQ